LFFVVCIDYFLNVETTFSPRRKARMKADAHKESKPINTTPLLLMSSPTLIRRRERMKQIEVSKAIVMLAFFIVCVVCLFVLLLFDGAMLQPF
jgi:hypothetical protein